MILGNPLALIGLATAIIIVLLYRRAQPSPQRTVTTGMLWDRVFADVSPRTEWLAKRDNVSCLLWLAILVLLVVAAAKPIVPGSKNTVVIVDNTISMSAVVEGEETRLDRAKSLVAPMIERLREVDRMAIISGGQPMSVRVALTANQSLLKKTADSIESAGADESLAVATGTDQIEAAVAQAKSMLDAAGGGRIVVLTDGSNLEDAEVIAKAPQVEIVRIGEPTDNVTISRFVARRPANDPKQIELMLEARVFADAPVECPVEISMPDGSTESFQMVIDPLPTRKFFTFETGDAAQFQAMIKHDDAIAADNEATTSVAPARLTRVYIPSIAFRQIWAADPSIVTYAERPPAESTSDSIALFCKQAPEQLPNCPILLIDPQTSGALWSVGPPLTRKIELGYAPVGNDSGATTDVSPDATGGDSTGRATRTLEEAIVGWCDTASPLIGKLPLTGIVLAAARQIDSTAAPEKTTVLARSADGGSPLILKIERDGAGPIVIITGDVFKQLEQVDAPITRWIARVPAILSALAGTASTDTDPAWKLAAADLPQLVEHDLRTTEIESAPTEPTAVEPIDLSLWTYLSLIAAALLIWEWRLYNRRWTN